MKKYVLITIVILIAEFGVAKAIHKKKADAIGKPIVNYLSPPYGVIMKIKNNKVTYSYYWDDGKVCTQTVNFNVDGIITKISETKACRGDHKISSNFVALSQRHLPSQGPVEARRSASFVTGE